MSKARAPLGLIAAAAMLAAHWVAYMVAAPDPHERAHLLQATGHGYLPVAISLAVAGLVFALGSFVNRQLNREMRTSRTSIFGHALPRFLALQVGGFAALEIVERVVSGHGFGAADLVTTTFVVGLVLQVFASLVAALLLVAIAFVVACVAPILATPEHDTVALPLVSLVHGPRLVPATGAHTLRGPPVRA